MRLIRFTEDHRTRIGLLKGDGVIDLGRASPGLPEDMLTFLEGGDEMMALAQKVSDVGVDYSLDEVRLECPIPRPPMI